MKFLSLRTVFIDLMVWAFYFYLPFFLRLSFYFFYCRLLAGEEPNPLQVLTSACLSDVFWSSSNGVLLGINWQFQGLGIFDSNCCRGREGGREGDNIL